MHVLGFWRQNIQVWYGLAVFFYVGFNFASEVAFFQISAGVPHPELAVGGFDGCIGALSFKVFPQSVQVYVVPRSTVFSC